MDSFYFPKSVYVDAHTDYLEKTGKSAEDVRRYCKYNIDFFVEVVFSYLDGLPYPIMNTDIGGNGR